MTLQVRDHHEERHHSREELAQPSVVDHSVIASEDLESCGATAHSFQQVVEAKVTSATNTQLDTLEPEVKVQPPDWSFYFDRKLATSAATTITISSSSSTEALITLPSLSEMKSQRPVCLVNYKSPLSSCYPVSECDFEYIATATRQQQEQQEQQTSPSNNNNNYKRYSPYFKSSYSTEGFSYCCSGGNVDNTSRGGGADVRYNHGRWTSREHEQFVLGFRTCGRDWSRIAREFVPTRMRSQVASHAQKYLMKLESGEFH